MQIDIEKIIEAWNKIISETSDKGKYSRNIFIECKVSLKASIVNPIKTKSVEFVFDKNKIDKKKLDFKETKGIKVDIEKDIDDDSKLILCVYLKSSAFQDTYLKLLEKIINSIFEIDDQDISFHKVKTHLSSWRKCFEDEHYQGLKKEEQIGLFGELTFIKEVYSKGINVEKILDFWKGPEGGLHDFRFRTCLVEVKTYSKNKNKIRISNMDQLNYNFFTNLYLSCVEIEHNHSGFTIVNLIDEIKNLIFKENQTLQKFEEKLSLYGYLDIHKENYKDKFLVTNLNYYKVDKGFPCILKNNLEIGVIDVSFSIELSSCEKFKCKFDFIV